MDIASPTGQSQENLLAPAERILQQILRRGGFELSYLIRAQETAASDNPEFVFDFSGPDAELLLERNASLLDALEYIVLRAARLPAEISERIVFDCRAWRCTRAEELRLTAQIAAERVVATGTRIELTPMNARERRIVHLALKDHPSVRTLSEGFGSDRRVVIFPSSSPDTR